MCAKSAYGLAEEKRSRESGPMPLGSDEMKPAAFAAKDFNLPFQCRICGNEKNPRLFRVREMMFGLREEFEYFQCAECECVQIVSFPADMKPYYPSDYYSFNEPLPSDTTKGIKNKFRMMRNKAHYENAGWLGKMLLKFRPEVDEFPDYLLKTRLPFGARILDVGCGNGARLCRLRNIGFSSLTGIDLNIPEDCLYLNGVRVLKKELKDLSESFDLVMFHHAFEHLEDQEGSLREAARVLRKDGVCLVRIPTVSSEAWEYYGVNWAQWDAPRHFFLHSEKSFERLAGKTGFKVSATLRDSTEFQFWASELYRKNIPLIPEGEKKIKLRPDHFSDMQMNDFKQKALKLNRENKGDQVQIYLKKRNHD